MKHNAITMFALAAACWLAGCASPFEWIDQRTTRLLAETNDSLGADTVDPRLDWPKGAKPGKQKSRDLLDEHPPTDNPDADQLIFRPDPAAESIVQRMDRDDATKADAVRMNLNDAMRYAFRHSREYRFAEEEYVLDVLRLLSERHLWGPRFFNDTIATVGGTSSGGGFYETAVGIVNDFRITQRLPYGGELSAQVLASASESLHSRMSTGTTFTAEAIFAADLPLLRGAGQVAREDLIQSERNVVYASRRFERFRRDFLVSITTDFLDLVVQQQAIGNARRGVGQFEASEQRELALVEAGRQPPYNAALAAQDTLFARDNLAGQIERYRLGVDRFQIRLAMPEELGLIIEPSRIGLPIPQIDMNESVRAAMTYRLDLQNRRDEIDDSRRGVNNARNNLLADLDLSASVSIPTNNRSGLIDFGLNDPSYAAALTLGLPIDRTIERLDLRDAQIDLERSIREYDRFRDTVAVEVRASVRGTNRARFSAQLQTENVRVAEIRVASILAAPDRASARDRSDAVIAMQAARDDYDTAQRDLQVAILQFLLTSGRLRVEPDGLIRPLAGMKLGDRRSSDSGEGVLDPGGALSYPKGHRG